MIRKATFTDIDAVLTLTKACANHMINNNIFQWNENYPSRMAFENDVERNELSVLIEENEVVGCVVISTHMDEEYHPINWMTSNEKNLYIHRLAVHPNHQGKGFAQQLMDYAENFAIENGFHSIRLDTFSKNHRNQKFYELRGYQRLGTIYFPKQSEYPFYCYERLL